MNYKLETMAGDDFTNVSKKAKEIATNQKTIVEFEFNGVVCLVDNETNIDWLHRDYSNSWTMKWKKVGPNCKSKYDINTRLLLNKRKKIEELKSAKRQEIYRRKEEKEQSQFAKKTKGIELDLKNVEQWNKSRQINSDGYGKAALDYAECWAKLMQIEIAKGETISKCYDYTQNGLGFLGITGFQFGCAVSILSQTWKYGDELRKVHNKKYGVSEDKKRTVNPAILTISKSV